MTSTVVTNAQELADAIGGGALEIEVQGTIAGSPMITLPPGATLRGGTLQFGAKGIRLTRDNTLDGVTVLTEPDEVAILNDTSVADLGRLTLRDVTTRGQVLLVAQDAVRGGHVQIEGSPSGRRTCGAGRCARTASGSRRSRVASPSGTCRPTRR